MTSLRRSAVTFALAVAIPPAAIVSTVLGGYVLLWFVPRDWREVVFGWSLLLAVLGSFLGSIVYLQRTFKPGILRGAVLLFGYLIVEVLTLFVGFVVSQALSGG